MERLLSNPRVLEDFLEREVGALERLAGEVLARHSVRKPVQKAELKEALELAAGA